MTEVEKADRREEAVSKEEKKEQRKAPLQRERSIPDILLHIKPAKLLILLLQEKQWHIAALARESNQSYVYATEVLKLFERSGIVSVTSSGRRRIAKLTEKGERIARAVEEIIGRQAEEKESQKQQASQPG